PVHQPLRSFPTRRSSDLSLGNAGWQSCDELAGGGFPDVTRPRGSHAAPEQKERVFCRGRCAFKLSPEAALKYRLCSELRVWPERDRKSTRLNSSHLGISY